MPAGPFKAVSNDFQRVKRAVNHCQLYKSPTSAQKLNSSTPVTFAWNNTCFNPVPKYVNIALLSSQGQIFRWEDVDASSGSFEASLDASWWHNANQAQLQVGISASDVPLFLSPFVAGPVFTAVNSNPTTSSSSHSGTATATVGLFDGGSVNVAKLNSKGLTKGGLAAAVLFPILIAFGAIAAYVWFSRRREARRRAEWATSVDNRMSTISENWQTMSHKDARPSMHSSRRTPRPSVHSRTMSMLGASEMKERTTLYEQYSSQPFAAEDESQLGPRARALSAAAAEGRPLSTLVNQKELPALPSGRIRSKSTAADGAFTVQAATSRIPYSRAPHSHTRTISTTSNNPYASAMAQRDSLAVSDNEKPLPFPTGVPIPRPRMNSNARSADGMTRSRVISHVSFADAPRPSTDRRRNGDPEKSGIRSSARETSTGDDFAIDFGDAFPALALMRVKSGEGLGGFDAPGDNALTPTKDFIPASRRPEYFGGMPNNGMGGRTPDEMLRAYASAMATNEKLEEGQPNPGIAGNALAAVRKLTGFWRK